MYTMQYQQTSNIAEQNPNGFCYQQSHFGEKPQEINRSMPGIPSNMVMIDQAQLMELLAAKQILDAQRAAASKPGFNSALFITPPRMSKENKTQCNTNANTSMDYGQVEPLKGQKPTVSFSAMPTSQSSNSERQSSFQNFDCDSKSEHSEDEQGHMLDDDLMRIIDDDCENSN